MADGNFEGTMQPQTIHIAAAQAAARDSVLMVRGFAPPYYSIPYPEYVEALRERNGSIPEAAEVALNAIRERVSQAAIERAESLSLGYSRV